MTAPTDLDQLDAAATSEGVSRRRFLSALGGSAAALAGGAAALSSACSPSVGPTAEPASAKPSELTRATVSELSDLIRRKQVSSLEAVEACLARIEQVNPKLNAVVALAAEQARADARAAD